jgi:hypothetical protein
MKNLITPREYLLSGRPACNLPHQISLYFNMRALENALFDSRNTPPSVITIERGVVPEAVVDEFRERLKNDVRTRHVTVRVMG